MSLASLTSEWRPQPSVQEMVLSGYVQNCLIRYLLEFRKDELTEQFVQAGSSLYEYDPSAVEAIISTIRSCLTTAKAQSLLTRPIAPLHSKETVGATEVGASDNHSSRVIF